MAGRLITRRWQVLLHTNRNRGTGKLAILAFINIRKGRDLICQENSISTQYFIKALQKDMTVYLSKVDCIYAQLLIKTQCKF